jgi:hypothetical protein
LEIVEDPSPANNFATVLNVISNAPATANATPPTLDLVLEWVLVRRREKEK